MNNLIRFIHRSVIKSNLEEFFVALRRRINVVRKFIPLSIRHRFASVGRFIPQSESYPPDDEYLLTRDDTQFRINRSDYVQWRIFYGVRDNSLAQAKKLLTPNSIVLDIGANFGAFSLRLASYVLHQEFSGIQIHAFEPNPQVSGRLNDNLELNPSLKAIVHVHPFGLGNEKRKYTFDFNNVNTGAGRIINEQESGKISIDVERLDDVVDRLRPSGISFIKMIVEGFEGEVFKGATKTIEKFRPPIFFEVTPHWYSEHGTSLTEILHQLRPLGYQFYGELHNELVPYDPAKFDGIIQYNLFAFI